MMSASGLKRLINRRIQPSLLPEMLTCPPPSPENPTGNMPASSAPLTATQGKVETTETRQPSPVTIFIQLCVIGLRPSATKRICISSP
jgi:hypothetical protein